MKLRYGESLDGGAWPGPLADRNAVFGELWVGVLGLVDRLETMLGLGGLHASGPQRVASMVRALRYAEGPWSRSLEADPIGVARRVLRVRDELVMAGWRGEALSPRLHLIAEVSASVPPGLPDRLRLIVAALPRMSLPLSTLELIDPICEHPRILRELFSMLEQGGTSVEVVPLQPALSTGDLRAARSRPFVPEADGTLEMVRAHGPTVAAEDLAAWLTSQDSIEDVVVIGADDLLDRALERFGLPATGQGRCANGLLAILPLVLSMAFDPIDPHQAYELLAMPLGPIPRRVAGPLIRALEQWPSTSSSAWRDALARSLERLEPADAADARDRIDGIFRPCVPRDRMYPRAEAERRARALRVWAARRSTSSDLSILERASLAQVREQCDDLAAFLLASGQEALRPSELFAWTGLASDRPPLPSRPACSGIHAVRNAESILAPAATVIWWRFQRPAAPPPDDRLLLTSDDRALLSARGVHLASPMERAVKGASRARRPLEMATSGLLLVCPRFGDDGDALDPHPLWDEIESSVSASERHRLADLIRDRPSLRRVARERVLVARSTPGRIREWACAGPIPKREEESPSSMQALIECSFRWALSYVLKVRAHLSGPPRLGPLVYGKLAHSVLERLLSSGELEVERAHEQAEAIFDELLDSHVPELQLPGRDYERGQVRSRIASAAAVLARAIAGARMVSVEQPRRLDEPFPIEGRPDLVLEDPPLVIDVKWQRRDDRIAELRHGTALQLATYAHILRDERSDHAVGYFIAYSGDLALVGADLPLARRIQGPSPRAVWHAGLAAFEERRAELDQGAIIAPGSSDDQPNKGRKSSLVDGRLDLVAPCRFCDHAVLCGRAYEEG